MIIKENSNIKISIHRVKGEPFHLRPICDCIKYNYHRIENGKDFKFINAWSYYIPIGNRFFWLWWCLTIKIKPTLLSGKAPIRYVDFKKTHLELLDLPHGSWRD